MTQGFVTSEEEKTFSGILLFQPQELARPYQPRAF